MDATVDQALTNGLQIYVIIYVSSKTLHLLPNGLPMSLQRNLNLSHRIKLFYQFSLVSQEMDWVTVAPICF